MADLDSAIAEAVALHRDGRLAEACGRFLCVAIAQQPRRHVAT